MVRETAIVEGIHCIFPIKTPHSVYHFGVHLPIPLTSPEKMVKSLQELGPGSRLGNSFQLDTIGKGDDYFFDLSKIKSIHEWFYNVRMTKMGLNDFENIPMAIHRLTHPIPEWYPLLPVYSILPNNFRAFVAHKD